MNDAQSRKGGSAESLDEQLRFAIANRRLIRVTYDNAARTGEPHDYGMQRGAARLLFYQLRRAGGKQDRGKTTGWRLLEVAKIEACTVTEKIFSGGRGSSDQQHLTWDTLFARAASPDSGNLPGRKR
jgi:hypothetical protein